MMIFAGWFLVLINAMACFSSLLHGHTFNAVMCFLMGSWIFYRLNFDGPELLKKKQMMTHTGRPGLRMGNRVEVIAENEYKGKRGWIRAFYLEAPDDAAVELDGDPESIHQIPLSDLAPERAG